MRNRTPPEVSNARATGLSRSPRVSIGIPVRNGERFIRAAIDSLLAQTFQDFEIIICDNDSPDQTPEISREYEARDQRVRFFRQPNNVGPAANHNKCFELSRGEFFRWHAHDDLCEPTYLQRCLEVLDSDRSIVNCHSYTRVIDENGVPLRDYNFHTRADASRPSDRFGGLINVSHRHHVGYEVFGLKRRAIMANLPLFGAYAHGDRVFNVRMSLHGRFFEVPEYLFLARAHASQSMAMPKPNGHHSLVARVFGPGPLPGPEWWNPSGRREMSFPDWNLLREYWRVASDRELDPSERIRCQRSVGKWVARYWPKLVRDVALAAEKLVARD